MTSYTQDIPLANAPDAPDCPGRYYPLTLDLRWRRMILGLGVVDSGVGTTLSIGSSGMLFNSDTALKAGDRIDLRIDWPVLLDGITPLCLRRGGIVVDGAGLTALVKFDNWHEFCLKGKDAPLPRRALLSFTWRGRMERAVRRGGNTPRKRLAHTYANLPTTTTSIGSCPSLALLS